MSVTLNNSDFQCLQDQLVELKTKNYELAEKNRRSQADFEAAKAKICTLQLKLEEQERDFQVTSTTLRREIEAVTSSTSDVSKENNKDEDYKAKYKKLLHKAKELQQRYEKSVEIVTQFDVQNKELTESVIRLEQENAKLKERLAIEGQETLHGDKFKTGDHIQNGPEDDSEAIQDENDSLKLKLEIVRLNDEINQLKREAESSAEERKIHERKGLQIVKELKRQLAVEKSRTETLQKRLENLLSQPPAVPNPELESRGRLSTSSSTNGNSSSNDNSGSRANQDANSVGSWSFVPFKEEKTSNPAQNETLSLCSIDSEGRETVQQPCDNTSEDSIQRVGSSDNASRQNVLDSSICSNNSAKKQTSTPTQTRDEVFKPVLGSPSLTSSHGINDGLLLEEQAALVDRLTQLQHDKWTLEEKLSYMEQANSSLTEDLANKSDIIKHYFMDQAQKASNSNHSDGFGNFGSSSMTKNFANRRISFPNNVNHILSDKPSLKKVVDFLKERSQVVSGESESISREATKKMQVMLEETLIKCIKLQENLDFVTSELNKLKN